MKRSQFRLRLMLILVSLFAQIGVRGEEEPDRSGSETQWNARRVESDGAMLIVLVQNKSWGGSIPLTIVLTNRGNSSFRAGETGYLLDCKITIATENGIVVPYTTTGTNIFGDGERSQYARRLYEPGKTHTWDINLAKFLQPLKPGKYFMTLETKIEFGGAQTGEPTKVVTISAKQIELNVQDEK